MRSSSSRLPYKKPVPVGPSILWPEAAKKSQSSARTSTGMWGADWAASTTTRAPTRCAASTISGSGLIVPSTFEAWMTPTSFVLGESNRLNSSSLRRPCSSTSTNFKTTPRRSRSSIQGTKNDAPALPQQHPGHKVGVVLHDREHDLVALFKLPEAPAVHHQIDRLRGVAGKNNFAPAAGVEELCHLLVGLLVEALERLDHGAGALGRRGVVQIDQELPVNFALKDGEVLPDPEGVQPPLCVRPRWGGHGGSRLPLGAFSLTARLPRLPPRPRPSPPPRGAPGPRRPGRPVRMPPSWVQTS